MCELWVFILKCMKIAYLPLEPTHAHICFSQHGETGNNIRKKKKGRKNLLEKLIIPYSYPRQWH